MEESKNGPQIILYIKKYYGFYSRSLCKNNNVDSDITVRAIGIITDYEIRSLPNIAEIARNVRWLYKKEFVVQNSKSNDKNNVRSNCVYKEFNLDVINRIVEKFVLV